MLMPKVSSFSCTSGSLLNQTCQNTDDSLIFVSDAFLSFMHYAILLLTWRFCSLTEILIHMSTHVINIPLAVLIITEEIRVQTDTCMYCMWYLLREQNFYFLIFIHFNIQRLFVIRKPVVESVVRSHIVNM